MKTRELESWLVSKGFTRKPGGMTSHRQYTLNGVTVTVAIAHGHSDVSKKHLSLIARQAARAMAPTSLETIKREVFKR